MNNAASEWVAHGPSKCVWAYGCIRTRPTAYGQNVGLDKSLRVRRRLHDIQQERYQLVHNLLLFRVQCTHLSHLAP
jgi:hypothetical protein